MLSIVLIALAALTPDALAGDCVEPSSPAQLGDTLNAVETAWTSADESGFMLEMEKAVLQLPCVASALEPALAARYHRDLGLWLFASQQPELAQQAFAAARRVGPEVGLPADLAPEGHPVRKLFDASESSSDAEPVPQPADGRVLFDGAEGPRPTQLNTIFQLEASSGEALTRYLRPDAVLPTYEIWVTPPETGPKGWHFAAGAGVAAVASGSLYMVTRSTHDSFTSDPPGNQDDLDALYKRNRACSTSSAILAGTAGALGVVAVFTW